MSQKFTVKVLLFAAARDAADAAEIEVHCSEPESIDCVIQRAASENSGLKRFLETSFLVAVNEEFAERSTIVDNACEVAILPPVSGG